MSPQTFRLLLIGNLAATWWMTGIVWFCAVVQYPLFANVGRESFVRYHAEHVRRTQRVVLLPMLAELVLSWMIVFASPAGRFGLLNMAGAALVGSVWLSTFFRQVPDHERLSSGFGIEAHERLLRGNLARCLLWSCHAVVAGLQCYLEMA